MIFVFYFVCEGFVLIIMGMVLCNELVDWIDFYVKMVYGLYVEGVVCRKKRFFMVY